MSAFFVTASGTGVGKTCVAAGLLRHYVGAGRAARAIKPVLSGFDAANFADGDSGVLLAAQGRPVDMDNIDAITPWRFTAALAPDMAARRENKTVPFDDIVAFSSRAVNERGGLLFIEGVGGVMAPLTETRTVLDWMTKLDLPLILVAGSYLGAISHALSAVETVRDRGLKIAALVVSESENSSVPFEETAASIARLAGRVPCTGLPRAPGAHAAAFFKLAEILGTGS